MEWRISYDRSLQFDHILEGVILHEGMTNQFVMPDPLVRICFQALVNEFEARKRNIDILRNSVVSLSDILGQVLRAVPCEGSETHYHLIYDSAERPYVSKVVVALAKQDLRSHVQRGSNVAGRRIKSLHFSSKSQISDHYLNFILVGIPSLKELGTHWFIVRQGGEVQQYVVEFEVPVYHILHIQLYEAHHKLRGDNLHYFLRQSPAFLVEQVSQIASIAVLEEQIDVVLGLLGVDEREDMLSVNFIHNLNFRL